MRKIIPFIVGLLLLIPVVAFAQTEILSATTATAALAPGGAIDPSMISTAISAIGDAIGHKDWPMLAGLILGVIVMIARMVIGDLKKPDAERKIPGAAVPFIVAGLSAVGAVSVGLQLHQSAFDIVKSAGLIAFVAIGGWEFASKGVEFLTGKIKGWFNKTPPAAPPPA